MTSLYFPSCMLPVGWLRILSFREFHEIFNFVFAKFFLEFRETAQCEIFKMLFRSHPTWILTAGSPNYTSLLLELKKLKCPVCYDFR